MGKPLSNKTTLIPKIQGFHLEIRQKSFLLQQYERDAIVQPDVVSAVALNSEAVTDSHTDKPSVSAEHGHGPERIDLKRRVRE